MSPADVVEHQPEFAGASLIITYSLDNDGFGTKDDGCNRNNPIGQ